MQKISVLTEKLALTKVTRMGVHDDTVRLSFHERDKFLSNILEVEKLTHKILEDRKKAKVDLDRLKEIIDFLYQEAKKSTG